MTLTNARRVPALLTALSAFGLIAAAVCPSQAAALIPTLPNTQAKAFAPELPLSPGPATVVFKLGRALLEEQGAQPNLRTETYRDEIEMAAKAPAKSASARG
ncbi:MAG: hypothetical protein M3Y28_06545 [Armatimonadota bacterium]|nr:hypothetical protein [Armatimonadota bacterium]